MATHLASTRPPRRVAVVCGTDTSTLDAVMRACTAGFITPVFVGQTARIRPQWETMMPGVPAEFVPTDDAAEAARLAVAMTRRGQADILMKGLVSTDVLLKAVLDKAEGLLPQGNVLTHLTAAEVKGYGKLLLFSDAAVMPYPTPLQRRAQIDYAVATCRAIGVAEPRVALIHCSEHVSEKFPHTADYRDIAAEAAAGRWGAVRIDGPLDVRTSCDAEALRVKGIASPVEGRADALIFPDIEAANAFYKTITFFAGAATAGMLCGTSRPVVLPSRGDDETTKFYSLALAALSDGHAHQEPA